MAKLLERVKRGGTHGGAAAGRPDEHSGNGERDHASGGALALVLIVFGTSPAALVGGMAGERYHRRSIAPDFRSGRDQWCARVWNGISVGRRTS
jgi:hypothetical protein